MNRILLYLFVILVASILPSCNTQKKGNEISTSQQSTHLPEAFNAFLNKFPQKEFPVKFPSNERYNEGDLEMIDEITKAAFLSDDIFEYGLDNLYYLSSIKIYPDLYSVVTLQVGEMGSYQYALINYNQEGKIISSKNVAHYRTGGGTTSWSSTVIENNGGLTINEMEEGRTTDYREKNSYTYSINAAGAILPTSIPAELITIFHNAVQKGNQYMISPRYGTSSSEVITDAFTLYSKGDSVMFSPNEYSFDVDSPDQYELVVDSYTKTPTGHRFTLKDEYNSHDKYETLSHLTLNSVKDNPGAYQVIFTPASFEHTPILDSDCDLVIAEANLSSYQTRNLPFIDSDYRIWSDGNGVNGLALGYADHFVKDLADKHNLILKKENEYSEGGDQETYYRLYENDGQLVLESLIDSNRDEVVAISLYTSLFKTDGGIGVGSTLEELLYAHENTSAIAGENVTIISVQSYQYARFVIYHIAGPPDSDVDIRGLNKNLKISRIDLQK